MRIAFYAPMKPPDHSSPSGDRRMARLLIAAMEAAGHQVELASRFRSYDGKGDAARQQRIAQVGGQLADRLIRRYGTRPRDQRPRAWFTYHLYHKAPDWLGPAVTRALKIPYVVAEASHAPKQKGGPWALGFDAAASALAAADLVLGLNPADGKCILPLLRDPDRLVALKPFIDTAAFTQAAAERKRHRKDLASRHGLDPETPLLLVVAMMRPGDKLASYRVLGDALTGILDRPWRLLVAGDGEARPQVEAALGGISERVVMLGEQDKTALPGLYAASDIYVWPAIREAYGMAFLEAQAAGLPVVAGRTGGVPAVVADGILVEPDDATAFARATARLLDDEEERRSMGAAAGARVRTEHHITAASRTLDQCLNRICPVEPA